MVTSVLTNSNLTQVRLQKNNSPVQPVHDEIDYFADLTLIKQESTEGQQFTSNNQNAKYQLSEIEVNAKLSDTKIHQMKQRARSSSKENSGGFFQFKNMKNLIRETTSFNGEKQFNLGKASTNILFLADPNNQKVIDSHILSTITEDLRGKPLFPQEICVSGYELQSYNEIKEIARKNWKAAVKIQALKIDNRKNLVQQLKKPGYFDKVFMIRGLCSCLPTKMKSACGGPVHTTHANYRDYINSSALHSNAPFKNECVEFLQGVIDLLNLDDENAMAFLGGPLDFTEHRGLAFQNQSEAFIDAWQEAVERIMNKNADRVNVGFIYLNLDQAMSEEAVNKKANKTLSYIDGNRCTAIIITPKKKKLEEVLANKINRSNSTLNLSRNKILKRI